jgi:hypothetical protein
MIPAPAEMSRLAIEEAQRVRELQRIAEMAAVVLFTTRPTDRALIGWHGWNPDLVDPVDLSAP